METAKKIRLAIEKIVGKEVNFVVEHPADEKNGDYATNVALLRSASFDGQATGNKNPRQLAEEIKEKLEKDKKLAGLVDKIEIAGPGFLNFWLKKAILTQEITSIVKKGKDYGGNKSLAGKKVMVEFTDPNPFKEFHIGHLMSNGIGEALARLVEFSGADLVRACYQGDVGMHVSKSIWGLQQLLGDKAMKIGDLEGEDLNERVKFLGKAYARGATAYEEDEEAKQEMNLLNKVIYERTDETINRLYDLGRQWSLDYFETIYKKLGTKFDYYFFESDAGERGLALVKEYLEKGIFEVSDGAVVFKGEKYGLHTRVFINALGLPTYEAKELGLAKAKHEKFAYDWSIVVTGNEIDEYFKVLLKVLSLIYPDLAAKTTHIGHGMLRLPSGKMSSRTGKVITGESLIDEVAEEIRKKMKEGGKVSKKEQEDTVMSIAVGAIKYSMLKQSPGKNIIFDLETSLSFEGDSGPYLQYGHARIKSVLAKAKVKTLPEVSEMNLNEEEERIARWIYRFPEVVEGAAKDLTPNLICSFAIELVQRFNAFYNKHSILEASDNEKDKRLVLTAAVGQVLANSLMVLGIKPVEKM